MTISRRTLLGLLPTAVLAQTRGRGAVFPSETKRYADPLTDFPVYRHTDPQHEAAVSGAFGRVMSRRGGFLVYTSHRTGRFEVFRLDVRSGQHRQLTEAEQLAPLTVQLMPDERGIAYFDAGRLSIAPLGGGRPREVYRCSDGFEPAALTIAEDALYAAVVERKENQHRLRLVPLGKGDAVTLAEADEPLCEPQPRPKRASVLYRRGDSTLFVTNYDARQTQRLKTPEGARIASPLWNSGGHAVLYLSTFRVEGGQSLYQIRELSPDVGHDAEIAKTSQFAAFGRNADGSVFVGASGSKAQPHILLLVRSVRRELTLCEHRSADASECAPFFSPNSQRIFFTSNQHGKTALYSVAVDRLVEETESQ